MIRTEYPVPNLHFSRRLLRIASLPPPHQQLPAARSCMHLGLRPGLKARPSLINLIRRGRRNSASSASSPYSHYPSLGPAATSSPPPTNEPPGPTSPQPPPPHPSSPPTSPHPPPSSSSAADHREEPAPVHLPSPRPEMAPVRLADHPKLAPPADLRAVQKSQKANNADGDDVHHGARTPLVCLIDSMADDSPGKIYSISG